MKKGNFLVELIHTPLSRQKVTHLKGLFKQIREQRKEAAKSFNVTLKRGTAATAVRDMREAIRRDMVLTAQNRFVIKATRTNLTEPAVPGTYSNSHQWACMGESGFVSPAEHRASMVVSTRDQLRRLRNSQKSRSFLIDASERDMLTSGTGFYYKKFIREKMRADKTPDRQTSKAEYVGIELECYVKNRENLTNDLIPMANHISIVGDGSIRPPVGFEAVEVRVITKKSELPDILLPVLSTIKANQGGVNPSCGTHVHFDMGRKALKEVERCYENLFWAQAILLSMMPADRRRSTYCKRAWYPTLEAQRGHNRYTLINVQAFEKHGTLEVRLHDGTLDGDELINWIGLIHTIMANEAPPKAETKEVGEFARIYGLSAKELAYVKGRVETFKHVPDFDSEGRVIMTDELRRSIGPEPVYQDDMGRWWCDGWVLSPVSREVWANNVADRMGFTVADPHIRRFPVGGNIRAACLVGPDCQECISITGTTEIRRSSYFMPVFLNDDGQWCDHLGTLTRQNRINWVRGTSAFLQRPRPSVDNPFPGAIDTWSPPCPVNDVDKCESCRIEATGADVMNAVGGASLLAPLAVHARGGKVDHRGRWCLYVDPKRYDIDRPLVLKGPLERVGVYEVPCLGKPLVLAPGAYSSEVVAFTIPPLLAPVEEVDEVDEEEESICNRCEQSECECCPECGYASCECCAECESYPCNCEEIEEQREQAV